MSKLHLFDIEGTTTDINFVHKVLFPYSNEKLEAFILKNPTLPVLEDVITTVWEEEKKKIDLAGVVQTLKSWIAADRKHGALKEIQGLIWDEGYKSKAYEGHMYEDVKPFFKKIIDRGEKIGIYSSGSVHAQKLIFAHSEAGDLTPMISYHFDTKVGAKREVRSYQHIVEAVKLAPEEICFYSDIPEELEAARAAGLKIQHIVRPGTKPSVYPMIKSFEEA